MSNTSARGPSKSLQAGVLTDAAGCRAIHWLSQLDINALKDYVRPIPLDSRQLRRGELDEVDIMTFAATSGVDVAWQVRYISVK